MSILCWNYRGFGNRQTIQELEDLVQAQDPAVVFLAETWLLNARLGGIKETLQIGDFFGVSKVSLGGGLALFWKKDVVVDVESSSLNHIDFLINKGKEDEWRFTGFYGASETQKRVKSWDLIRSLHNRFRVPCLVVGDFNEIIKSSEKRGGRLRPYLQMQNFCDALDECGLMDMGFVGSRFTWFKKCANDVYV